MPKANCHCDDFSGSTGFERAIRKPTSFEAMHANIPIFWTHLSDFVSNSTFLALQQRVALSEGQNSHSSPDFGISKVVVMFRFMCFGV